MAQKSITSFFSKVNAKKEESTRKNELSSDEEMAESPKKVAALTNETKRKSEDGDSPLKSRKSSKKMKIESSSEEEEESPKAESPKKKEKSPKTQKKADKTEKTLKASKKEEKPEKTPKSSKKTEKPEKKEKTPKGSKKASAENKSPKKPSPIKEEENASPKKEEKASPKKEETSLKKSPVATQKMLSIVADADLGNYDPSKKKYHPINDAFWKGTVPYIALAKTLEMIEDTSSRLKMIEILANFFRSVIANSKSDLLPCIYLCLNKIAPAYEGIELGVAETTLMKAIANTTGRSMQQIKADAQKTGDLGIVAEQSKTKQKMMFKPAALTVPGVFAKLKTIAGLSGNAAMSKKTDVIQSMFVACRQSEARFIIRSLAGKLRIGLAEQSLLQALAMACAMTPPELETYSKDEDLNRLKGLSETSAKSKVDEVAFTIKTVYSRCPNYDQIVAALCEFGVDELSEKCIMLTGVPVKPMLALPTKGVSEVFERFEGLNFTCEWKYDGERAQIHIDEDGKVSIYSRNSENNTTKYPDVIQRIEGVKKSGVKSCILDTEAVAWDKENKKILPFQILSTRKRKDVNEADVKVQVCIYMFDLLYFNGESLVEEPFAKRRELLYKHFNEVEGEWKFATKLDTNDMDQVQTFLEEAIKGNCEGLMVKTLEKDATYEIAKRSKNWLKLKKDYMSSVGDSLDLVVLGGYKGKGKRLGGYGGFLLACYDNDNEVYQCICKIGTGFSDEDLATHAAFFKEHVIPKPKSYYAFDSGYEPDEWFEPVQVWEIKCADLSISPVYKAALGIVDKEKGVSLRFPRFIRIREDKKPEDATNAQQVADMYLNQDQIKNQQSSKAATNEEDDYDY